VRKFSGPALKKTLLLCLVLSTVTLALYWPVLFHPFADYDDDTYVTANAMVQSGVNRTSLIWALTSTEQSNWHPLTWISHELDYQIYGPKPAGHHFTNLALHVMNVLLLFLLLLFATNETAPSFLVALLFAIHPLGVESVAWIAERKNLLSTSFFLLAIGAYGWYAEKPGVKRYSAVFAMFLPALASKPMAITMPCVLLLLDYWPLRRVVGETTPSGLPQFPWFRLFLEKGPLFLLSLGSAVITIFAQDSSGALKPLVDLPFGVRLENAIYAYAEYIYKVLWPTALAPHYPHPGTSLALWKVACALGFLTAVSALVWRNSSRRYLLVGWLWFLGTLVPVIGLVQVGDQAIADRYMYIPMIGLLVIVVWGVKDLFGRTHKPKVPMSVQFAIGGLVLIGLAFATHRQIGFWNTSYDLWTHTLAVTKDNYVAEDNLGVALSNLGRDDEALAHFYNAERIAPADPAGHLNVAAILESRGEMRHALAEYAATMKLAAAHPQAARNSKLLAAALANIGTLYSVNGNYEKARENYRQALRINPTALNDLIAKFYRFAAAQPSGERYLWLGEMLEESGRLDEAGDAYTRALKIDPRLTEAGLSLDRLKLLRNRAAAHAK
jgi:tetratricopeptide (TPR) repeat protein